MIFEYDSYPGCKSQCDIEIHRYEGFTVVLCSQRSDTPNHPYLTDAVISDYPEKIATQVCAEHDIDTDTLVWIEHFAEKIIPEANSESWDIVVFENYGERIETWIDVRPLWRMIPKHEALAILAGIRRTPKEHFGLHTEPSGPAFT